MNATLRGAALTALAAITLLAGCTNAKDMQIQELQEENATLRALNDDLESRLMTCREDADRSRQIALSLQEQLDDVRSRQNLAATSPEVELPEGFTGSAAGGIVWTELSQDILFDSGRATLKPEAKAEIQRVGNQIQSNWPGWQVWIVGHTDSDPIRVTKNLWKDNLDLSLNRAAAVAREIYGTGLARDKVFVAGQGEYRPKAQGASKAVKAQNRRVEFIVVNTSG